ncbi:DUF2975 domain-containing protein [Streptomyces sp. NPDC006798]|uniref:DUF2975 domain-containing protein n=1 Tax=Streptomyces sp. NPDC006798 TaxID=3155462 RepID=UPI0033D2DC0B
MNTRLTKALSSATLALAVFCGLVFTGKSLTRLGDNGDVCVGTGFWQNFTLADELPVNPGVEAGGSAARLCQEAPALAQRAADLGSTVPWLLFGAIALLFFSRLLKIVATEGPFTARAANGLTALGWLVTVGTPLTGLVDGWSHSWLVHSMAPIVDSGPEFSGPMVLTLAGLAAVVMGKVTQEGVRMREDLEGTI